MPGTSSAAVPCGRARKTASAVGRSASTRCGPWRPGAGGSLPIALVVAAASDEPDELDRRVPGEEADQLGPDVAGGTDDRDPDRGGGSGRRSAAVAASRLALTGAFGRSRSAVSCGVRGGSPSWMHDYTSRRIVMQPDRDRRGSAACPIRDHAPTWTRPLVVGVGLVGQDVRPALGTGDDDLARFVEGRGAGPDHPVPWWTSVAPADSIALTGQYFVADSSMQRRIAASSRPDPRPRG